MHPRKIDVVFSVPGYDEFDTCIPVTRITADQLKQLQDALTTATHPADACPTSITLQYTDEISFLIGGKRCDKMVSQHRTVKISDLFFLAKFETEKPACGKCKSKTEIAMTRHCVKNLRAGKCTDKFMRTTVGAALFPKLYANEKQK